MKTKSALPQALNPRLLLDLVQTNTFARAQRKPRLRVHVCSYLLEVFERKSHMH